MIRRIAATGIALLACPAFAADLTVHVSGVEKAEGTVFVALFASATDYDADRQHAGTFAAASSPGIRVVFSDLAPGRYGLSTFHDVNGNEKLDTNLVGIPSEPYGFSRNAAGRFGPPGFDDMAVEVGGDDLTIEIELQ